MFKETLEAKTERVFESLGKLQWMDDYYLAGGTALALQLGHRKSVDLDFFSIQDFELNKLESSLKEVGRVKVLSKDEGTLHVNLNNVLVSFLRYRYKLLYKKINFEDVNMADWRDIACMKISAISDRGSKKDFVDLHFLLKQISLQKILSLFERKYKGIEYNKVHILKSLVFFDDAEKDPSPKMLESVTWSDIKRDIKKSVESLLN